VDGKEEDGRGFCSCLLSHSSTHHLAYIGQPRVLATSVVVTWLPLTKFAFKVRINDWKVLHTG